MKSTESLKNNIWKTYAYQVFYQSDSFYFPIVVLFWQAHGLSLSQVTLLQSLFAFALFALDLPSGYFADQWGRKKSLIIGAVSLAIGAAGYILSQSFTHFLVSELFLALGFASISGADSAMTYDTLKNLGREKEYKKIWGRAQFYRMLCMGGFNIVGAFIAKGNLRIPFYLCFAGMLLAILIAFLFEEPKHERTEPITNHLKNLWKTLKYGLVQNVKIRWMMVCSAVLYAFAFVTLWFYQPYFQLAGVNVAYFGLIFAAFQVVAATAAKYAHRLHEQLGKKIIIVGLIGILALNYLLVGYFVYYWSFLLMFLLQFARGVQGVVFADYINELTSSEMRATMLSAQSSLSMPTYAAIIPIFGMLADNIGVAHMFTVVGFCTLIFGGIVLIPLRKNKLI